MRYNLTIFLLTAFRSTKFRTRNKIRPGIDVLIVIQKQCKSSPILTPCWSHRSSTHRWTMGCIFKSRSSRKHYAPGVAEIKEAKLQQKLASYHPTVANENTSRAVTPLIGTNFEANWSTESTPPDNTIAIANNGNIVTANNDGIEYYNASGTFLYFDFWSDFSDDASLPASIFDPKSSMTVALTGLFSSSAWSNPNTSKVLVCLSKTNNHWMDVDLYTHW